MKNLKIKLLDIIITVLSIYLLITVAHTSGPIDVKQAAIPVAFIFMELLDPIMSKPQE